MGLILDIDKIMYQLSRWRPIFHSEADFQFSLAWMIKEQYPNCDIRLEFVPEFNPNLHLDILVILDGKWIPIELKYTTRKCIKTINDEVYVLKEQGAKDQGCYNYLKDIMRIEEFRDKSDKFIEGYTIKITSEISYLKPPTKVNCTYAEFSIEEGSIKTGCMNTIYRYYLNQLIYNYHLNRFSKIVEIGLSTNLLASLIYRRTILTL